MAPPLIPMWITNALFLGTALFCAFREMNMQHRDDRESIPLHLRWSPLAEAATCIILTILASVGAAVNKITHWLSIGLLLIGLIILGAALCHRHFVWRSLERVRRHPGPH